MTSLPPMNHHQIQHLKDLIVKQEKRVKKSICSVQYATQALKTVILILLYYTFSISLVFYNQHLFHHGHYAVSITMCHLVFKFVVAGILRSLLEWKNKEERVMLEWPMYLKRLCVAGVVSSLDIGISNWSFEFVTVSLYTMSKSTAVIFILLFSLMFRLEKFRWSLILVVSFIFTGLFLFTFRSTQFNTHGFILVMTASLLSGLRWTLAQIVLQRNEIGLHNPIDMMYHIQPWMILALLPLSASIEGIGLSSSAKYFGFTEWSVVLTSVGRILPGAMLGFMLEFSEFLLLSHTSSLTLSVAGIVKEMCVLLLAYFVKHDNMSLLNGIGLVICVCGVVIHIISKAVHSQDPDQAYKLNSSAESMEMLVQQQDDNDPGSESDEVDLFSVDRDR